MSRTFIGFGQVAYIGQPSSRAIKIFGISGQSVPLFFQWISYGASTAVPNINVLVNLDTSACKGLDQIRSVYIDNLGSVNPVYLYFPDTGQTLAAKANSEGWYPAFTNAKQMWVIGEGFLNGSIPQTFIIVSNVALPPSVNTEIDQAVNLWLASPVITRGNSIYNAALGVPALGDQIFVSPLLGMQISGSVAGMWNTPFVSGFLYVRTIQVIGQNVSSSGITSASIVLESTGVAGTLIPLTFNVNNVNVQGNNVLLDLKDMQLKLDATQTWRLRNTNTAPSGSIFGISAFTQQP